MDAISDVAEIWYEEANSYMDPPSNVNFFLWLMLLFFPCKTSRMAADEPLEVENWVRDRVLGSGGFGQVTLWRHKTKDEMIGEVQLYVCQAYLRFYQAWLDS